MILKIFEQTYNCNSIERTTTDTLKIEYIVEEHNIPKMFETVFEDVIDEKTGEVTVIARELPVSPSMRIGDIQTMTHGGISDLTAYKITEGKKKYTAADLPFESETDSIASIRLALAELAELVENRIGGA